MSDNVPAVVLYRECRKFGVVQLPPASAPLTTEVLVRTRFVGVCGTDRELALASKLDAPDGDGYLIVGHELLAEVVATGADVEGFEPGATVTAMVRRPCDGCFNCDRGRSDICRTGRFREHGIQGLHGFARGELTLPADALVRLPADTDVTGVLIEPLSVVVKALEAARRVRRSDPDGDHSVWTVLVLGCGSIGLLSTAALLDEGHAVTVADRRQVDHPAAGIAIALGADYENIRDANPLSVLDPAFDVIVEATGSGLLTLNAARLLRPGGVLVQVGTAQGFHEESVDVSRLVRTVVDRQLAIVGVASASTAHFHSAARLLPTLSKLRGFPEIVSDICNVDDFERALHPGPHTVKAVLSFD